MFIRHLLILIALGGSVLMAATPTMPPSAHGDFVQRRVLADVGVTLTSKGTFRFERDCFFEWNTLEPVASSFIATPTNWTFRANGRVRSQQLASDVSSIAGIFAIKEVRELVKEVECIPDDAFPRLVVVKFRNGDRLDVELVRRDIAEPGK